jgi:hypothetical protein
MLDNGLLLGLPGIPPTGVFSFAFLCPLRDNRPERNSLAEAATKRGAFCPAKGSGEAQTS